MSQNSLKFIVFLLITNKQTLVHVETNSGYLQCEPIMVGQ